MFKEGILDSILRTIRRFIPKRLFAFGAAIYHPLLSWTGAIRYGFPSRRLKVIGVTGTKGKSTVVFMAATLLEGAGYPVAAIGSLGYKIRHRQWPNALKMTMPGRWKLQKFLREAVRAGCTHVVVEVPSEGLAQGRHLGVRFDCAVFVNIHPEHLEAHGGFERYRAAKSLLLAATRHWHVLNADDPLLAPRERDTWFHLKNYKEIEFEEFFNKYYDVFPDYKLDRLAYTFYLYQRYLADLEGFMEVIMFSGSINTIPESIDRSFHFPNIVEVVVLNIEKPRTSTPPNILITWKISIMANENKIEP
jgi:UDP-N-acetylmuramoyl-L-alanyl-D-glutamate--2,6-diaminopimelate ligase